MKRSILITTSAAVALLLAAGPTFVAAGPGHDHTGVRQRFENFGPDVRHREYVAPSLLRDSAPFTAPLNANPVQIAVHFAQTSLTDSEFVIRNAYTSDHNGVTHVYLRQIVDGVEVTNADININVDRFGRIVSYGDSFYKGKEYTLRANARVNEQDESSVMEIVEGISNKVGQFVFGTQWSGLKKRSPRKRGTTDSTVYSIANPSSTVISPIDALQSLADHIKVVLPDVASISILESSIPITTASSFQHSQPVMTLNNVPFALSPVPVRQAYLQLDNGELQLVWDLQVEMQDNWFHAHVNAHTGEVIALMDWVADATAYRVFPFGLNDPSDGERQLVVDPHDTIASRNGWVNYGPNDDDKRIGKKTKGYNTTIGNNVYAHENLQGGSQWEDNHRPLGKHEEDPVSGLVFDFRLNWHKQEPEDYVDGSVVNLFYWNNIIHDLFYRYGFDEQSGNFQEDNFGLGGLGHDAVVANAQDGSGYNNANFATPPDGQRGKMRMYVWDATTPMRDGDLESGIIIHEYAHGISTRLTGGPANSGCLGWGEAGGMGEGWGDFFATALRTKVNDTRESDYDMGSWANGGEGIRKYPYTTSLKKNPETYGIMSKPGYYGVHAKGAVWAEMLYEVYWNLVDKHGYTKQWFPPTDEDDEFAERPRKGPKKPSHPDSPATRHILSYGNTLTLQLVVDGLKLQPCRPDFTDARDAILQADELLTNGDNACEIWKAFAKRGLGVGAKLEGGSPWGGGERTESSHVPKECQ
ncbi:Fungalysin metallopeptidase-domain-containing protein [Jimgerdemannia flammicorona]|uniref:Extracellular metalloproteinase n=1 Tax=Jimgerdemannia flammicorona TaxID=994334 RepID=A0A433Q5F3_9FUNG|nr:Fungalysin metallopeptidase-domain-containing protein [Jimgerdemannia flammicorona]